MDAHWRRDTPFPALHRQRRNGVCEEAPGWARSQDADGGSVRVILRGLPDTLLVNSLREAWARSFVWIVPE